MKYILLTLAGIYCLWYTVESFACNGVEVKPIKITAGYPRGYLYKNYTPCRGKWYPKGYVCPKRKKVAK